MAGGAFAVHLQEEQEGESDASGCATLEQLDVHRKEVGEDAGVNSGEKARASELGEALQRRGSIHRALGYEQTADSERVTQRSRNREMQRTGSEQFASMYATTMDAAKVFGCDIGVASSDPSRSVSVSGST
jgi:hypothetical protein